MIRSLLCLLCLAGTASAVTYSLDAFVTAPAPTLFFVYKEQPPGVIVLDNTHPVTSALMGTAGAAGGNVELFATGDSDPLYQNPASNLAFATVPLVSLTGTANGAAFNLSSLNGTIWFSSSACKSRKTASARRSNAGLE